MFKENRYPWMCCVREGRDGQGKRGALGSAPGPASLPGTRAVRQPELKEDTAESHIRPVLMTQRLQREGKSI